MHAKWITGTLALALFLTGCGHKQDAPQASHGNNQPSAAQSANHSERETQALSAPASGSQDAAKYALQKPAHRQQPDAFFEDYGTNPFIATEDDHLSTFAVDVDTGSYSVVRNYIHEGTLPPEKAIRVEEFINYFPAPYPAPTKGTFAIHVEGAPSPFGKGYDLLRIGVKGKEIPVQKRKDAHLVFVIDVSGSMNEENRLGLVKKSLRVLVNQLNENDQVGIVVYGSEGRRVLEPTSIVHKEKILQVIDELESEGSTNAEEGLQLGYAMAAEAFDEEAANRVILCSDGVANVGETGPDGILRTIEQYASRGIFLSTFGFGMDTYNDVLMEQLADKGDGTYAYIDSFSEARRIFTETLTGTLQTIAKDAKIQVEFDPQKVDRYRLIGYENRDVRDEDFRNDQVDGGEVGAGHTVTALYEVKRKNPLDNSLGAVRLRYQLPDSGKVQELQQPLHLSQQLPRDVQFLAAVAEYGEIMRNSFWAKESSLREVLSLAEASAQGEEQLEFVRLVKDSISLKGE